MKTSAGCHALLAAARARAASGARPAHYRIRQKICMNHLVSIPGLRQHTPGPRDQHPIPGTVPGNPGRLACMVSTGIATCHPQAAVHWAAVTLAHTVLLHVQYT